MPQNTSAINARFLTLTAGRKLSYQIYGPADGRPIYFFHGFPGSRIQARIVESQAVAEGICLVAFDRPGFGLSDPQPGRKAEAYRQGISGSMQEAHLIGSPRPYDLAGIRTPVDVWQGVHDRHVPPEMGKYIAATVQQGRFFECPADGHLSVVITQFSSCIRRIAASLEQVAG